ncbi:cyanidin 3-O-glucoside 7-O-glucosyltransferase (acyl-glucose)-like isoform X2 [Magnolia sinica]|uniref:cyanidin 3-O-glucoside 7-O-glucosyltransferase (acyl-glucose)-like isoform X2 n=1 Tax=Magnolia sinica TaxID=86752 RepID=UPI00265A8556|nr:cyanidin 3-O-glucoside 7-O-glucosyltransferase (acyl-glucose)-like isoform X2 [Magnolia sinica]
MLGVSSLLLLILLTLSEVRFAQNTPKLSSDDFPPGFVFGAGTSAYQVEGAVAEDGRSPSIWDTYTHAGKMIDKSTADVSADQYHKYKEDVKLLREMGLDAYRFSISWSRLLPLGRGTVNPKGVQYYNNLINELINHGIQPHVTIHHLDQPQILEDEYGGWLSPKMVEDFTAYADVCFREFGDRVAHWTTINEPNIMALASYNDGILPPGRCSYSLIVNCTAGNSSVEPYIVVHHVLLAHASAAALYREKYQAKQKGFIGLNMYSFWCIPLTNSTADVKATQRALDFVHGWIIHPLMFGDYPEVMKKNAGSRIPSFTKLESERVKGSIDFLGLNHYSTFYVEDDPNGPNSKAQDFFADMFAIITSWKDNTPSGQVTSKPLVTSVLILSHWIPNRDWNQILPFNLPAVPSGLQDFLEHVKNEYGNPPIYIHENGFAGPKNETLNDTSRVEYLSGYLNATLSTIRNGSNTKGYFVWSFLDVFEVLGGYTNRYGLYHVDFEDKARTRRPKFSAHWYAEFLKKSKEIDIEMSSQLATTRPAL